MLDTLKTFCALHATPGDEAVVFAELERRWRAQRLDIRRLGPYAILGEPGERKKSDTLLLLAHADSPGFIVSAVRSPTELEVLALGGELPGNEIQSPMAKVILGGLLSSTLLNAFVIPIVYDIFSEKEEQK